MDPIIVLSLEELWSRTEQQIAGELIAKGYEATVRIERDTARFWVNMATGKRRVFADQGEYGFQLFGGERLTEAAGKALRAIADLPHADACAPWFDPAHPMNRPARPEAEAA